MKPAKTAKMWLLIVAVWCGANPVFAQTWTQTSAPTKNWQSIASSADGSKLIAGGLSWIYCISTNSGDTWISNSEPQKLSSYGSWTSIASSADGTTLVGINFTAIWVSTNSGLTWVSNNVPGASFFASMALSADGTKLVVVDGKQNIPGLIYISTNSGVTVTPTTAPTNSWTSVASSADGIKLVATTWNTQAQSGLIGGSGGFIYASTNSGLTWTLTGAPTNNGWIAVASSADGSKLVSANEPLQSNVPPFAIVSPGLVYTSTDSGMTWVSNNVPNSVWQGIASSADGSRLVAVSQGGNAIYTSTNSGATWISNSVPAEIWYGVASSADGDKLTAVSISGIGGSNPGHIYTSYSIPTPQLNVIHSSSNLEISWIIPSTNFVLQQSSDLISWADMTNLPTLNLTNLQNEVMLSPTGSSGFYRLKMP